MIAVASRSFLRRRADATDASRRSGPDGPDPLSRGVTVWLRGGRYADFLRTYRGVAIAAVRGTMLTNRTFNNAVVAGGAGISAGRYPEQGFRHHNVGFDRDPGFVGEAAGDYTLRADAVIFKAIPGFEPRPFAKMGRIKSAHDAAQPPRRNKP